MVTCECADMAAARCLSASVLAAVSTVSTSSERARATAAAALEVSSSVSRASARARDAAASADALAAASLSDTYASANRDNECKQERPHVSLGDVVHH